MPSPVLLRQVQLSKLSRFHGGESVARKALSLVDEQGAPKIIKIANRFMDRVFLPGFSLEDPVSTFPR